MERFVDLKPFNTFGLPVVASYFVNISDVTELEDLIATNVFHESRKLILGGGSNLLFLDDFFDGLVIQLITGAGKLLGRKKISYLSRLRPEPTGQPLLMKWLMQPIVDSKIWL